MTYLTRLVVIVKLKSIALLYLYKIMSPPVPPLAENVSPLILFSHPTGSGLSPPFSPQPLWEA